MCLTSWQNVDIFLTFHVMTCCWLHDKLFDFMTNILTSWRTNFWTSWRTFLSNDEFLVIMTCVDIMTNFITPWCVYDMTHFGCDKRFGTMTYVTLIHVMTNVLASWNILTTWHTFWRLGALFDVMSNFITSWCVFTFCWHDVFLNPWPAFCRIDFFLISGTQYNKNVFLILWQHFGCHDVFFMSWRTFWRHDVFLSSWQIV